MWVDDPHFNARYHVRHTALPRPGSEQQLKNLAGRVFSQQLDREKPLWEIWLVDKLEGDRFALLAKTHHALVDGISGVDITTVLFDAAPDAPPPAPPERAVGAAAAAERRPAAGRGAGRARHRCRPRSCAARARCCAGRAGCCAAWSTTPAAVGALACRRRQPRPEPR